MGPAKILAKNVRALMAASAELGTIRKVVDATDGRVSNGRLGRITLASHVTDVETLAQLAEVFKVEPWQLLVPDLNPENLPLIASSGLLSEIKSLVLARQEKPEPAKKTTVKKIRPALDRSTLVSTKTVVEGQRNEGSKPKRSPKPRPRGGIKGAS